MKWANSENGTLQEYSKHINAHIHRAQEETTKLLAPQELQNAISLKSPFRDNDSVLSNSSLDLQKELHALPPPEIRNTAGYTKWCSAQSAQYKKRKLDKK